MAKRPIARPQRRPIQTGVGDPRSNLADIILQQLATKEAPVQVAGGLTSKDYQRARARLSVSRAGGTGTRTGRKAGPSLKGRARPGASIAEQQAVEQLEISERLEASPIGTSEQARERALEAEAAKRGIDVETLEELLLQSR